MFLKITVRLSVLWFVEDVLIIPGGHVYINV